VDIDIMSIFDKKTSKTFGGQDSSCKLGKIDSIWFDAHGIACAWLREQR